MEAKKAMEDFMVNDDDDDDDDDEGAAAAAAKKAAEIRFEKAVSARRFRLRTYEANGHLGEDQFADVNLLNPKAKFKDVKKKAATKKKKTGQKK